MPVHAQVPQVLNYQGRVTVGATNFTGTGQFRFALVDGTGATTYWSNGTSEVSVPVTKGLYAVLLGDDGMNSLPATVFTEADVRLRASSTARSSVPTSASAPSGSPNNDHLLTNYPQSLSLVAADVRRHTAF